MAVFTPANHDKEGYLWVQLGIPRETISPEKSHVPLAQQALALTCILKLSDILPKNHMLIC